MTSARFLTAVVLAACALVASVLVAIPTDSPDTLSDDTVTAGYTATVPPVAGKTEGSVYRPASRSLQPVEEGHGELPRIWLGSPMR
jgi:hypothetical protein